jgi:signal recognition particle subunit SRP54
MFEALTERLGEVWRGLRARGKLTEADIDEALRQVRLALLEADVAFTAVKAFLSLVRQRAMGERVLTSLTPGQTVIHIVHESLIEFLGGTAARPPWSPKPPTVWMLVGLQGSGKTSLAQKLALFARREGHRPLLVADDLRRPAAIEQLEMLGRQIEVPVFARPSDDPVAVAVAGLEEARRRGLDLVILDTSGRTDLDEDLLEELRALRAAVRPTAVLLVADAMTGQAAVDVGARFDAAVGIDGVCLTKLDGDARGGAALSFRHQLGKPIYFAATGERAEALEPFHPDRMASRILGMGDVLTLIERARQEVSEREAQEMAERVRGGDFDLDDFLRQLRQLRRMGPLQELLAMIPGLPATLKGRSVDERELKRVEAILSSMTPAERRDPRILNASRKRRIARGSGTEVADVNRLLRQFEEMRRLVRQLGRLRGGRTLPRL